MTRPARVVLLVSGDPGAGKSHLSRQLRDHHAFDAMGTDALYLRFIQTACPMLYFEALHLYIGPHHDHILSHREHSKARFGRDFVAEWRAHVATRVLERAMRSPRLVVDGYLLAPCEAEVRARLADVAQVFGITVKGRTYYREDQALTAEQIAQLGQA